MDADLSSDLEAFVPMTELLKTVEYDVATGSRLLNPQLTTRCLKWEFISNGYNLIVRFVLKARFSDAQCGFKAITRSAGKALLPLTTDTNWFFDTELLTLADKLGYRIHDLPVRWTENLDSHVQVVPTAIWFLKELLNLRR